MPNYLSRTLILACTVAAGAAFASPAAAISRIDAQSRTCAELRQVVNNQRAVIIRHPGSAASGTLYDRYVSASQYCDPGNVAMEDWVPAKDRNCMLYNCQTYEPPFDN